MALYILATRRLPTSSAREQAMVRLDGFLQLLKGAGCEVLGDTTTHGPLAKRVVVLDADEAAIDGVGAQPPDVVHLERAIWHEAAGHLRATIEGNGEPL